MTMPYPDRGANVTSTEAIAHALVLIAEGHALPPGTFDLLNYPQWTWYEVYKREASVIGRDLVLVGNREEKGSISAPTQSLKSSLAEWAGRVGLREAALKIVGKLPARLVDAIKADYAVSRARRALADLHSPLPLRNSAMLWPSLEARYFPTQPVTATLIDSGEFSLERANPLKWHEVASAVPVASDARG